MAKSTDAFRTIGEVSDDLDVPKHVLRFWEGKFPQLKPMKRGGGRRFYRPEDVALLRGIHHLLHDAGYTIKGVQRILRDDGVDAVKTAAMAGTPAEHAAPAPAVAARKSRSSAPPAPLASELSLDIKQQLADLVRDLQACVSLARVGPGTAAVAPAVARPAAGKLKR